MLHTRFQTRYARAEVRTQGHSNGDELSSEALRRCYTPGRSRPGCSGLGLGLVVVAAAVVVAVAATLAAAAGVVVLSIPKHRVADLVEVVEAEELRRWVAEALAPRCSEP